MTLAERHYAALPAADHDLGRLELTRALVLRGLDRFDEGLRAVRTAGGIFAANADLHRMRLARSIEAYLVYRAGDVRKALQLWCVLEDDLSRNGDPMRGSVLHNMSVAYRDAGDLEAAINCLKQAMEAHAAAGETVNLAKTRWVVAKILVQENRWEEADAILGDVITDFERLQMREDVVLARLDRAELLILQQRFDDAAATCRAAVEELKRAGLVHTVRALTAVSYLTEATVAGKATAALARRVRDFVRDVGTQPALLFAPPPL